MTDSATIDRRNAQPIFRATYSEWKLVKTRSVIQVIFEVPLDREGEAYDVLGGMPHPGKEIWCAIARLNANGKDGDANSLGPECSPETGQHKTTPAPDDAPVRAPIPFSEKPYDQQAGILCSKPRFRRFLAEHDNAPGILMYDIDTAAQRVREICQVQSRTEIRPGTAAEQRWLLLVSAAQAWQLAPGVGAA